jgi:hypothetical protein
MRLPNLNGVTNVLDSAITCVPLKAEDWRSNAKLAKFQPGIREWCEIFLSPVRPIPPEPVPLAAPEHTHHSNGSSCCRSIPDSLFLPTIEETPSLDLSYIVAQMDSALLAYEKAEDDIACNLPYLKDLPPIRHPEPLDRKPIDNVYRAWLGNFGSFAQHGRGTYDKNGNPTCLTHWVAYNALESIVPGNKWCDWTNYSADILNRQPDFDINGKPFDTNEHYLDTATPDKVDALKSTCVTHLMFVIICAYVNGYDSFDALVYGTNPGKFWDPIINKAYELATKYIVDHHPKPESIRNFPLRVIKIIHFCAVIHNLSVEKKRSMDVAITEFARPDADTDAQPCIFFRTIDFTRKGFWSSGSGLPYLVEFAICLYGVHLQHIPLHELHQYIDIPPSLLRRFKSEMKGMVDNANNDAKNFQHRRRFVSNGEPGRIRIKLNTTLASIRDETRPTSIVIKRIGTPFVDSDMTLVDNLRWQGVKSAEARKKNAAKRKADGISAAPPQQVANSDSSRPRKKKKTCEHYGCNKRVQRKGVCILHGAVVQPRAKRTCKHPGCNKRVQRKGVCIRHGAVIQNRPRTKKRTCKVPDCNKWARSEGVCIRHGAVIQYRPQAKRTCKFPDCGNWSVRGGVCIRHGAEKRTCKVPNCEKWVQRNGACILHGANR